MKVQITHLKAPWPIGAVVGDVLDLPSVPVWAAGKCKQVEDDVELTIVTGDGTGEALKPLEPFEEFLGDESKITASLAEAEKQAVEELAAMTARKAKHK